ncbi:hypothetical protein [Lysobacter gummosus]|uniref:hypothetical protein n=1 Tax=Lysobacter gummosus TaxID=262324 RepID=UPI00362F70E5
MRARNCRHRRNRETSRALMRPFGPPSPAFGRRVRRECRSAYSRSSTPSSASAFCISCRAESLSFS